MVFIGVVGLSGETCQVRHVLSVIVGGGDLHHVGVKGDDLSVSVVAGAHGLSIEAVYACLLVILAGAKAAGIGDAQADGSDGLCLHGPPVFVGFLDGGDDVAVAVVERHGGAGDGIQGGFLISA